MNDKNTYKKTSFKIIILGIIFFAIGLCIGFIAPLEMYCYYLFSNNGPFYYEGFGFGSFIFANITGQIIGYYTISIISFILAYGHLKMKKWLLHIMNALIKCWFIIGIPIILITIFILLSTKDYNLYISLFIIILMISSYTILPKLLLNFYNSKNVITSFQNHDPQNYWIEKKPVPIIILTILYIFFLIILHIKIMLNGIYPLFGNFIYKMNGIVFIDISILLLCFTIFGTIRCKAWAWYSGIIGMFLYTISLSISLVNTGYKNILYRLELPLVEFDAFSGIPLEGYHLAIITGIPLIATIIFIFKSKKAFNNKNF